MRASYRLIRRWIPEVEILRRLWDYRRKDARQQAFADAFHTRDAIEVFRERKSSDTMFILGSGPTINEIQDHEWNVIGTHDSFGFNNWPVHWFVPTFYMTETISTDELNEPMLAMLADRAEAYSDVPVLIKEAYRFYQTWGTVFPVEKLPESYRRNFVCSPQFTPPASTSEDLRAQLKAWERLAVLHPAFGRRLISYRASVFLAVHLAYMCGYNKIVLAGIDMKSPKYFWEVSNAYKDYGLPANRAVSSVHRTQDASLGLPISEALFVLNKELLSPKGVLLEVTSPNSLLAEFLPIHDFGANARPPNPGV